MKRKRFAAVLIAALMTVVLSVPALAEEWEGKDLTFTVPEEIKYTMTPLTVAEDPSWALAGVADPSAKLEDYRDMSAVADFYTEDGKTNIIVTEKTTSTSENIFSLKEMSEEERAKFLENLLQSKSEDIVIQKSYIDVSGQPFYRLKTDGVTEAGELHSLMYGTIVNGHTLNFEMYTGANEATEEQTALLERMVTSVKITQVMEKPEATPVDIAPTLVMLGVLVLVVLVPIVYLPIKGKMDKKARAKMAERLSEYHKTHGEKAALGEPRFINETECTKEAVHSFSIYQAYVKSLGSLIIGFVICAAVLAASFLMNAEWWLKLLSAGVTIYYIYRVINMPGAIEKIQLKVFQRGVSSTARYSFHDKVFRVSGIQAGSVYPYFQITDVRKHGHYLYLYYGPENAYLVDQFGFEQGEYEEFEKFIREKAGK